MEIDPFKDFTPRGNKPTEARTASKDFIAELSDDQLRKLAREQLSMALQAVNPIHQPEMTRKLCAELLDRLDGKPGQAITMDANVNVVTVNATVEFIRASRDNLVIDHVDSSMK